MEELSAKSISKRKLNMRISGRVALKYSMHLVLTIKTRLNQFSFVPAFHIISYTRQHIRLVFAYEINEMNRYRSAHF